MTKGMVRFALAQTNPIKGNIAENLRAHQQFCLEAAKIGADIIVFPELSLTGYEPPLLAELAQERFSSVFQELSQVAVDNNLTVIAGCPIKSEDIKPYIGAVICYPTGHIDFYLKQYLHPGESDYCVAGNGNYSFSINRTQIALAVCADFTESRHQQDAQDEGADIYLVSALISKGGFSDDELILSGIADQLQIPVLLSNFIGETGGWDTVGKSGVWDENGRIVFQGSDDIAGMTLCTIYDGHVKEAGFSTIEGNL